MAVRKRSVTIAGHRTSFSVEDRFFELLQRSAKRRRIPLAALIAAVDAEKPRDSNLSSALRLFVLEEAMAGRLELTSATARD